jgi:D-beta-D-heptose 7-phosphate kinase/D-beta-D-heptose 1-phosphate adenosyltransferase
METIVLITGGFDPIHSGHIAYINAARELGDRLIVGVNTDPWLDRKKGRAFMTWSERAAIVGNLKAVDEVLEFDDFDGSARDAIRRVRARYPATRIIFGNGGDRTQTNIPEMDVEDANLEFQFSVGGNNKANSSSWILEDWKAPKTVRPWGYYRVLYEQGRATKVKELVVEPGQRLSMQRHKHRNEIWYVAQGAATVYTLDEDGEPIFNIKCKEQNNLMILSDQWHQLCNFEDVPLKIVEIQYGDQCTEDDIERKEV